MVATAEGSTVDHSPVPGLRKSGMPEAVETPAPVSATTRRACRMSSAMWTSASMLRSVSIRRAREYQVQLRAWCDAYVGVASVTPRRLRRQEIDGPEQIGG